MSQKKRWELFGLVAILGLLLVLFRANILPDRFDGDAISISAAAEMVDENPEATYIDKNYTNAGRVYGALKIADKPVVAGVIAYLLVAVLCAIVIWRWEGATRVDSWGVVGVTAVILLLSATYLGTLSKDFFAVLFVATPLVLGGRHKWGFPVALLGAVVFGLLFRPYYVVVALVALGYWSLWKFFRPKLWQWLGIIAIAAIAGSIAYLCVTGQDISTIRGLNNSGSSAVSMLSNLVEENSAWWSGPINSLLTGLMMVVPMPLLLAGGAYHIGAAILMLGAVTILVWLMRDNNFKKPASIALVFLIGLFTVQCLFEPDLGSVLRHWTTLGVLLLYAFCGARGEYEQA